MLYYFSCQNQGSLLYSMMHDKGWKHKELSSQRDRVDLGWVNEHREKHHQSVEQIITQSTISNSLPSITQQYIFKNIPNVLTSTPSLGTSAMVDLDCYYSLISNENEIISIVETKQQVSTAIISNKQIAMVSQIIKQPLIIFNLESAITLYAIVIKEPFEISVFKNGYVKFFTPVFVGMKNPNKCSQCICPLENYLDFFATDSLQNAIWKEICALIIIYIIEQRVFWKFNNRTSNEPNCFQILKFTFQMDMDNRVFMKNCRHIIKWSSKNTTISDIKADMLLHIYEIIIRLLKSIQKVKNQFISLKPITKRMHAEEIKNALKSIKFNPSVQREEIFSLYKKNPKDIIQIFSASKNITRKDIDRAEREDSEDKRTISRLYGRVSICKPAYTLSESVGDSIEHDYHKYIRDQTLKSPVIKRKLNWKKCLDLNTYIDERSFANDSPEYDKQRLVSSIESLSRTKNKQGFVEAWESLYVDFPSHNLNEKELERIYNLKKSSLIAYKVMKRKKSPFRTKRVSKNVEISTDMKSIDLLFNNIASITSIHSDKKKHNKATLQSLVNNRPRQFCAQSYSNFLAKLQLVYKDV